jgi:hypothetical protein
MGAVVRFKDGNIFMIPCPVMMTPLGPQVPDAFEIKNPFSETDEFIWIKRSRFNPYKNRILYKEVI